MADMENIIFSDLIMVETWYEIIFFKNNLFWLATILIHPKSVKYSIYENNKLVSF